MFKQVGPSLKNILENDVTTRNQIAEISTTLQESFQMGITYLGEKTYSIKRKKNYLPQESGSMEQAGLKM